MRNICLFLLIALSPLPASAGWQPLFNGNDLSGWDGEKRFWRVEDGVLIGETNDTDRKLGASSYLVWQGGEPADFELEFRARVKGNNSGVQYRSKVTDSATWMVSGYQMDLHAGNNLLGMLYEVDGRGPVCERGQRVKLGDKPEVTGTFETEPLDLAEWNSYRIVAQGHVLRHFINGKLAAEIHDVHPEKRALSGIIAFQLHEGAPMKVEFKDIRIHQQDKAEVGGSPAPAWIWSSVTPSSSEKVFFRRELQLPDDLTSAAITITCDDFLLLYVNGKEMGFDFEWSSSSNFNVLPHLKPGGRNVIAVEGRNDDGTAGMAMRFRATSKSGKKLHVVTDANWICSNEGGGAWQSPEFDASKWKKAVVVAQMGDAPWGEVIKPEVENIASAQDVTADYNLPVGFHLEKLYRVPADQGSWVAVTQDDKGRLYCSDQYGKIYRVTVGGSSEGAPQAEPLEIPLSGAHGLLWNEGVLWVTIAEGSDQSGIWKVTDTNGDGTPDKPELVKAFEGQGEHGPHGLVLAPDGKSIYVTVGNFTNMAKMDRSFVSEKWAEDQLLPRRPDSGGHANDRMAPGGWVAKFDTDGKNFELVSSGFRNSYDLAFNEHGDLFTYDSDMEWDLGMPWYRPTRICQVVPGSEFGWRNGTGPWPPYYEDSMPPVLEIGPGSPTGMVSGAGAKFPAKYQRAVYALDWTFATIYAIHLTPEGSSYRAEREEFISGSGLPLTDAIIGKDGAMYFLTGGRRTESTLWRIVYRGDESVAPIEKQKVPDNAALAAVQQDRRVLDAVVRGKTLEPDSLVALWKNLGSDDRLQRYSARLVLEKVAVADWVGRLQNETNPWTVISAALAAARIGDKDQAATVLNVLDRLDWAALNTHQQLNWLRAVGLVFARQGEPDVEIRQRVIKKIDAHFPAKDEMLNRELCRLLSYLQAPGIVARTLTLMDSSGPEAAPPWLDLAKRNADYGKTVELMIANLPPAQVIHYVYCLRVVKGPWHADERKRFFGWLTKLAGNSGGTSYAGFITDLRKQALATCTPEELLWIEKLPTHVPVNPFANLPQIAGPGREWTVDEVVKLAESGLENRNLQRGKDMFRASLCASCHRFGSEGGASGPDLTSAGGRFAIKDLAEAILEPSKVISDQYGFDLILRKDGTQLSGKLIEEKDEKWIIATSAFDLTQTSEIERNAIQEIKKSPVSPMPPGLINRLNPDELKDLLAYLLGK